MRLSSGARLGRYEIISALGSGGMGDVYRARDSRLHRDVAIKVMSHEAADALSLARFAREGQAIAALSHPNICAVYDTGSATDRPFLVMELLDGETLHARLTRGPLKISEIVTYAIALSDALDAAHAKGLIHRDLKPGNIFLTTRGQPKILDFGLAKSIDASDEVTREEPRTLPGSAAGTIAYMSPEQLKGEPLDRRTDLFSLGLVLYEMATGRRPFEGSTTNVIAAAILSADPPPPRRLRHELHPKLEEIILKALEKEPELRYQSAAELRADLKRLQRESIGAGVQAPMAPVPAPAEHVPALGTSDTIALPSSDSEMVVGVLRRHWVATAALVVVVISAIAGAMFLILGRQYGGQTSGTESPRRLEIVPLSFSGDIRFPTISPDGRFVAFHRSRGLWIRQLSAAHADTDVQIVAPVEGRNYRSLTFTPDGAFIDYVTVEEQKRDLWRIPLLGGSPAIVVKNVASAVGWSSDGRHLAFVRATGLVADASVVVADADGSHERVLTTRRDPKAFVNTTYPGSPAGRPSWSPDGTTLALAGSSAETSEIVLIDSVSGAEKRVVPLEGQAVLQVVWLDATRLLAEVADNGPQRLSTFDTQAGTWTPLTHEFVAFQNVTLAADRKTAVMTRTERRTGIWLATSTGANHRMLVEQNPSAPGNPFVDDTGGVFYSVLRSGGVLPGVYRIAPGTTQPTLVVNGTKGFSVSRDGRVVVFTDHNNALIRMNLDGSSRVTLVDRNAAAPSITPDGKTVLYSPYGPGLFSIPVEGGTPRRISERMVLGAPVVSLDGTRVAFLGDDVSKVCVCDLPACTNPVEVAINTGGGTRGFTWSPDGRGIAFAPAEDTKNLWVQPLDGGPKYAVTKFDDPTLQLWEFAWSYDGKQLALSRGRFFDDLVLIKGLQ